MFTRRLLQSAFILVLAAAPLAQTRAAETAATGATDSIGVIVATDGIVTVTHAVGDAPQNVKAGTAIAMNETVETGVGARAVLVFNDQSDLILGENAQMVIDKFVYNPVDEHANMFKGNILRGAFLFTGGLIGKKEKPDVSITTQVGSIGMRGTKVWGGVLDTYSVFVADGSVFVTTKRGSVRVQAGEGTDVADAKAIPTHPKVWGEPKINRALATITLPVSADDAIAAEKIRLQDLYKVGAVDADKKAADDAGKTQPEPEPALDDAITPEEIEKELPPAGEELPEQKDGFGSDEKQPPAKKPSAL